jgi:hypothetical protein
MDLVGESSLDSYSMNETKSINDDNNTTSRACPDKRVMHIYTDDINEVGDGGTSDADGEGYDSVKDFRTTMHNANLDCNLNDNDKIEEGLLDDERNESSFLVSADEVTSVLTSLHGAPVGWKPLLPPKNYTSPKLKHNEPPFDQIDNPGNWCPYTF